MKRRSQTVPCVGSRSIESIRDDFPILRGETGRGIAYLDNAATSHKPAVVIDAVRSYYEEANSNVHRAVHRLATEATRRYEEARKKIAAFIGAPSERSIVFTRGTTESINLVASSWGGEFLEPGDVVLLTEMEHHANIIPWQLLASRTGVELVFLPFDASGRLELDRLAGLWSDRVKLVSMIHVSNVFGTLNDIESVIRFAHDRDAPVLIDAAQSVPHGPIDVAALDVDFLAFSGHKMCGPTGIGVLYAKEELLDAMPPYMGGGEMIRAVWLDRAEWNDIPYKFEAGTPNIAGAVGLGAAVDYLTSIGMSDIQAYERDLCVYAIEALSEIEGVTLYGPPPGDDREAVVSFTVDGVHAHDAAQMLDREGVAVRPGHHCAHPLTRKLGVPATVRASFYLYSTYDEIDRLTAAIEKAKSFFI